MRKLVLYTLTSVDGAVEDPRRYFPDSTTTVASAPVFDPVMARLEADLIGSQDAVLLGRHTFDEWSRYWPTSDEQPFADFMNSVKKYVITSTPIPHIWDHTERVAGFLVDTVDDLKARNGRDIGVHGSITLARSLLAAGLADELHLAVGAVLDPVGPRLFEHLDGLRRLELVSATPTPSGTVWMTYRIPENPPGAS